MARVTMLATTLAACALLVGCPGASSTPAPGGTDGGSGLAFADGGSGSWYADSAPGALGAGPDGSGPTPMAPDSGTAVVPDSYVPNNNSCPFGNLLATIPTLPPLCRPFPQPQASPTSPDPASCQAAAHLTLTANPDQFTGGDTTKDSVSGMEGNDTIKGLGCSDWINGNMGEDWINGNQGDDTIHGGKDDDTIHGGQGNDLIYGDRGHDTLYGDLHDDQYFYAEGDGHDVIEETGGHDRIVCAAADDKPRAHLQGWSRVGDDLLLMMSGNGSIRVKQFFTLPDRGIELIVSCQ